MASTDKLWENRDTVKAKQCGCLCELGDQAKCCEHADSRPISEHGRYLNYEDGQGDLFTANRHSFYCQTCRIRCQKKGENDPGSSPFSFRGGRCPSQTHWGFSLPPAESSTTKQNSKKKNPDDKENSVKKLSPQEQEALRERSQTHRGFSLPPAESSITKQNSKKKNPDEKENSVKKLSPQDQEVFWERYSKKAVMEATIRERMQKKVEDATLKKKKKKSKKAKVSTWPWNHSNFRVTWPKTNKKMKERTKQKLLVLDTVDEDDTEPHDTKKTEAVSFGDFYVTANAGNERFDGLLVIEEEKYDEDWPPLVQKSGAEQQSSDEDTFASYFAVENASMVDDISLVNTVSLETEAWDIVSGCESVVSFSTFGSVLEEQKQDDPLSYRSALLSGGPIRAISIHVFPSVPLPRVKARNKPRKHHGDCGDDCDDLSDGDFWSLIRDAAKGMRGGKPRFRFKGHPNVKPPCNCLGCRSDKKGAFRSAEKERAVTKQSCKEMEKYKVNVNC